MRGDDRGAARADRRRIAHVSGTERHRLAAARLRARSNARFRRGTSSTATGLMSAQGHGLASASPACARSHARSSRTCASAALAGMYSAEATRAVPAASSEIIATRDGGRASARPRICAAPAQEHRSRQEQQHDPGDQHQRRRRAALRKHQPRVLRPHRARRRGIDVELQQQRIGNGRIRTALDERARFRRTPCRSPSPPED